jgi:Ca-activated chloride channel family protein
MGRLFNKLENPVITGLNVQWPAGVLVEQYPSVVPDLYAGEPVVVTAKITGALTANTVVTLTGQTGAIPWTRELSISGTSAKPENTVLTSGLAAAWGRLKIEDLMSSTFLGAQMQAVREKVIETSVEYQLLSQYTSFIAVEQVVSRPQELPLMGAHVPLDIPSGQLLASRLSGLGQGMNVVMPATATGVVGHLLSGLLAFFAAAFLFWRNRRKEVLWGN